MRKILLACLFFGLFGCKSTEKATHVVNDTQNPRYLFVLNANDGTFDGKELILVGVSTVVYFSDRPTRIAGHMSLQKFAKIWDKEEGTSTANLSILQLDSAGDITIELKDVDVKGGNISFEVGQVKGDIPKVFKQSAIFIDMMSINDDHFALEDYHPLDCSCGNIAESN